MKKFLREKLTALLFLGVLITLGALTVLLPKDAVSTSERRKLAVFPVFSAETLLSGKFGEGLSDYAVDHFALRESFRAVNTALRTGVLRQQTVEGVWEENGFLFNSPDALNEKAVTLSAGKMQAVIDRYFPENISVYFAVVPDKSAFSAGGPPRLSAQEVAEAIGGQVTAQYIDILPTLALEDYYRTDTHWRQEKLLDTVNALMQGMGREYADPGFDFRALERPFYGVLWGRYAAPLPAETLYYGVNDATENALVTNYEKGNGALSPVYETDTDSPDLYDVFLSGAAAYIEVENPDARTGRHLVLFRDSFGSSIAPYLLTEYAKLSIIDMRYISADYVGTILDAGSVDDVLFLYSAALLNSGGVLR